MLFIQAATKCAWRVLTEASGALGVLISGAGSLAEALGLKAGMPNWVWIAIGAALLFITACKIELELMRERESRRKPEPNMTLEEVVKRIRGKDDIFGPESSESMEVKRAFTWIEERAKTGAITVFAVKGISYFPDKGNADAYVRRFPVPANEWETHVIDYLAFLDDPKGRITPYSPTEEAKVGSGYAYVWFDRGEINSIWPAPKRKMRWRWPLSFK
jgi:hypothetical protein